MLKNVAGQQWQVFAFNETTGLPVSGDEDNITADIKVGAGAALVATDDTNPTPVAGKPGYYVFDLLQAETNADQIWIYPTSATSGVRVIGAPGHQAPYTPEIAGIPVGSAAEYFDDGELTLVQRADYTAASALGPLRIPITNSAVSAGDTVRFGATLPGGDRVAATGTVVDIGGTLHTEIELTRASHTDVAATDRGHYEIEHLASGGEVSPLLVDEPLVIQPSHAEP